MKQDSQNDMKRVSAKVDQMQGFVIINNVGMMINADVNAKNIRSIWNASNCECECDKLCDVGEYLGFQNCKGRKKLVDKLVAECTENIDEVKIAKITLVGHENACVFSYIIYVILAVIAFAISIGIGTYFTYSPCYLKKDVTRIKFDTRTQWNWIQRSCAQTTI